MTTKYQEGAVLVELIGLVAIIKGDKILIGIEANKIRKLFGCIFTTNNIPTSHISKIIHDQGLEPEVGRLESLVSKFCNPFCDHT